MMKERKKGRNEEWKKERKKELNKFKYSCLFTKYFNTFQKSNRAYLFIGWGYSVKGRGLKLAMKEIIYKYKYIYREYNHNLTCSVTGSSLGLSSVLMCTICRELHRKRFREFANINAAPIWCCAYLDIQTKEISILLER